MSKCKVFSVQRKNFAFFAVVGQLRQKRGVCRCGKSALFALYGFSRRTPLVFCDFRFASLTKNACVQYSNFALYHDSYIVYRQKNIVFHSGK